MAGTSIEPHGPAAGAQAGAEVATTHHGAVVSYNPDAPSEEWGWHGSFRERIAPRGSRILLWLGVVGLLLLAFFGNHDSQTEVYWLTTIAALMAIWIVAGEIHIKRERRRRP
jgi:hypothetical protein